MMHLVVVEDNVEGLYPFSVLHCTWELRCGPERCIDAWTRMMRPSSLEFCGREAHIASFLARFPRTLPSSSNSPTLVVRSSLLPTRSMCAALLQAVKAAGEHPVSEQATFTRFVVDSTTLALLYPHDVPVHAEDILDEAALATSNWVTCELDGVLVNNLYASLDHVADSIADFDFSSLSAAAEYSQQTSGVFLLHPERVFIGSNIRIDPCVVLDASDGPIIIESGVHVQAHSVLMGPCFIGQGSKIKAGAKIYPHSVIGELCKVGGEVENSIIHAFSNKQHEGFLGHSYIGEWVNLGADTNTSDLKNTYGAIRITRRSKPVDTGRMFLGLLCGDHTKSGINTMFTTGTVCGIHANVFGAGYAPQEISSFAWGAIGDNRRYPLKKAISVAETVMQRRGRILLPEEVALMEAEFNLHASQ